MYQKEVKFFFSPPVQRKLGTEEDAREELSCFENVTQEGQYFGAQGKAKIIREIPWICEIKMDGMEKIVTQVLLFTFL